MMGKRLLLENRQALFRQDFANYSNYPHYTNYIDYFNYSNDYSDYYLHLQDSHENTKLSFHSLLGICRQIADQ